MTRRISDERLAHLQDGWQRQSEIAASNGADEHAETCYDTACGLRELAALRDENERRDDFETLLQHIAALSREVEELRKDSDQDIDRMERAAEAVEILTKLVADGTNEIAIHREALRWVLEHGVVMAIHHIDGKPHPRLVNNGDYDSMEPPAHLRAVLAKAMEGKS